MNYSESGVNIKEADQMVDDIKKYIGKNIGLYGGLFPIYKYLKNYEKPVLVSSTDGVGTKMMLLEKENRLDIAANDLIAMNVNDLVCMGAKPLFFMDYYATGKLKKEQANSFIKSLSKILSDMDCELLGGETAELPGLFKESSVDVGGFVVGIVEENEILGPQKVREGDLVIGISSSGVHSNGFSLVRKLIAEGLIENDSSIIEPTKLYVKQTLAIKNLINSAAHITGGGIEGNLSRVIPEGLGVEIKFNWLLPDIFKKIANSGIKMKDMLETFNMGIGMIYIIPEENIEKVEKILADYDEKIILKSKIKKSNQKVKIEY
ncbi:MAG: phosphoribosylformylglycinamidine cyclo-ligase [Thermotogota bacterium]